VHTDGWGTPIQCPAARRCKVCPHAGGPPDARTHSDEAPTAEPEFALALREDDGTLIVGIRPDGHITTGPRYRPDASTREFWDAVTRAVQAASPIPMSKEQQA
jgi:hypothetical protein